MIHLEKTIERCHERHNNPLRQRKSVPVPAMLYQKYPYQYTVYCAHKYPILLDDLERANISYSAIGQAPRYDNGHSDIREDAFLQRQKIRNTSVSRWESSWGINIYTGTPSEYDNAKWHDLDFKYEAICAEPEYVHKCIEMLVNAVENPLLTMTKSGGLRFSCRITDYLHPEDEIERLYIHKYTPTHDNPIHRDIYLEIFGNRCKTRWDARYEILLGNLLEPPVLPKEVLFAPIKALRKELHDPIPKNILHEQKNINSKVSLASNNLNLGKSALLKRGFHYLRQENDIHYWTRQGGDVNNTELMLWENDNTVWIRSLTPNVGIPTDATPIAYVWSDTSIPPPTLTNTIPLSDKIQAVRKGKLSPLAIKRKPSVLHQESKQNDPSQTKMEQIKRALDTNARIIGLSISDTNVQNEAIDHFLSNSDKICLHIPYNTNHYLNKHANIRYTLWKDRMHRWEKVKDIPIKERMANPFKNGNVCEDPERCNTLEHKGINPTDILCPQCPVYQECQERGYLSQPAAMRQAKKQIFVSHHMFFNPHHAILLDDILKQTEQDEIRQCIIFNKRSYRFFLLCNLSIEVINQWIENWKGNALGNFARNLLHTLEIKRQSHSDAVKRLRTVMQTFEWQEKDLIQQMCQINVSGRIVDRGYINGDSGMELARFSAKFEGGAQAYIPIDSKAATILTEKGEPHLNPTTFYPNKDITIPLSLENAIAIGIYKIDTVENIEKLPTVSPIPTWTFWHQLKLFLAHYQYDADTPLRWDHDILQFELPPILHPSIKQLVLLDKTEAALHLRNIFPNETVGVSRINTTSWKKGNCVFQIRTGLYPRYELIGYSHAWDIINPTNIGQRFITGISAEIKNNPKVRHTIVADKPVLEQFKMIVNTENVRFVEYSVFRLNSAKRTDVNFEDTDVIWIFGMPQIPIGIIWKRAQMLFGHDNNPLCYDTGKKPHHFKDNRIQSLYNENCVAVIKRFVEHANVNRNPNRKIVILTSLMLPDITDRPDTTLFDWEDFEIAGSLDKLADTIATRQHFETEKANLTAESGRDKVQQVLGCSVVYANRVLNKLRGGNIPRVSFRDQIIKLLADGEKKVSTLIEAIEGNPTSVKNELKRLVDIGEIVKVRHGVYTLPNT